MHFITSLTTGGAEMMLYKTVSNINYKKYKPVVCTLISGPIEEKVRKKGITVYNLNLKRKLFLLFSIYRLVKIINKEKPSIIHTYMFHADIIGRIIARICRIPIVISSIRNENIGGRLREKLLGVTDFLVDSVTAVCKSAGDKQVQEGTTKPEKLTIIYNGIEIDNFKQLNESTKLKIKRTLNIPLDHYVFITIGRLHRQKNHKLLLKAFAKILEINKKCSLIVVGDGPLKLDLINLATELKINNNVVFTGPRDDIPNLLAISDVFVLASSWEGLPNVILEAMAAEKPIIATSVGGVPEVVENNKNGFLIKPDDKNELTNTLIKMLELSNNERNEMGKIGRCIVEKKFTIKRTIETTEQLYSELLRNKGLN